MSKVVLKNNQRQAVVKITSEDATTIDLADVAYDVKVESGVPEFGSAGSRGETTRTQTPTKLDISKIIYSMPQDGGKHVKVGRGGTTVIILGGCGEMNLAGSGVM